jgi:Flp pilus assembly pilin Flp
LVLVAVALIGVLTTLGDALRNRIQDVIDKLPTP